MEKQPPVRKITSVKSDSVCDASNQCQQCPIIKTFYILFLLSMHATHELYDHMFTSMSTTSHILYIIGDVKKNSPQC